MHTYKKEIQMKRFIKLSQKIGENPAYVQGRGGNTSYKHNGKLYIKASGFLLKEMTEHKGYVICKEQMIKSFFDSNNNTEDKESALNRYIEKSLETKDKKPSIETAMHAVIPSKYVLHTHSIYANVFNCIKNSEKYLSKIIENYAYIIVPYKNPGYMLADYLVTLQKQKKLPQIIFLQNHGLLLHGENALEIYKLHEEINTYLCHFLKQYIDTQFVIEEKSTDFPNHLFPDSVVYSHVSPKTIPEGKKQELYEISSAINFIHNAIFSLKESPRYISSEDVAYIQSMEREKLRIQLITT